MGILEAATQRMKMEEARYEEQIAALKAENERLAAALDDADMVKREAIAGWKEAERALAERAGGVKVPIGYALVPVEPTDRMVSAYVAAKPKGAGFNHPRKGDDKKAWFAAHEKKCRERWKAMLSVSALTEPATPSTLVDQITDDVWAADKSDENPAVIDRDGPAAPEGRREAVAWQHIPGCGTDRESKMVFVSEGVFCDPCIAPLVAALNAAGIETVASCCGHDHRPGSIALRDGRCLVIARDLDEWRKIDAIFPIDINGNTRPAEQAVTEAMVEAAQAKLRELGWTYNANHVCDALKAAMEAGR